MGNNKKIVLLALIVLSSCVSDLKEKKDRKLKAYFLSRAEYFFSREDYLDAKKYYDSLLIIDSLNGQFFYRRAYSKSMLLDLNGAIADYTKAIEINPKRMNAYLAIGIIYHSTKYYKEAIPYFNKCLEIEPHNKKAISLKEDCVKKIEKISTI